MEYRKISFDITDGIARIVLDDPERHNTVDLRFTEELLDAAIACETTDDVRCVVMSARGPVFSFGGDLVEFLANREEIQAHVRRMTANFHQAILILHRLDAPFVAAVQGTAAGGGFSLVCAADLAIAARSAKFSSAYTRSGLTPDGGSTYFLTRLVGPQRAFDLMATNPVLSAEDALRLGIVSRVVEDGALDATVVDVVGRLCALPPGALPRLKGLLQAAATSSLEAQFEREARSISALAATPTTLATLEAFLRR